MDDYTTLYTMVATNLFSEPKFYKEVDKETGLVKAQNQDDKLLKLARKVAQEDPEFVLKLAAYARNDLYLRTIPTILWVETALTRRGQDNSIIRRYAPSILKRADQPGEAIAYYLARVGSSLGNGGKHPNSARKGVMLSHSIQKGIEDAIFANYDRYQISKYDRTNVSVTWKDIVNLVHPDPMKTKDSGRFAPENWSRLFYDVVSSNLSPAETWEDTLMNWRKKGFESKKAAWEYVITKIWGV